MNDYENFLVSAVARKKQEENQAAQAEERAEQQFTVDQFNRVARAVVDSTSVLVKFLQAYQGSTKVTNFPTSIKTPDIDRVVKAVNHLETALAPIDNVDIVTALEAVGKKIEAIPTTDKVEVSNLNDLKATISGDLRDILITLRGLEVKPKISLPAPIVNVEKPDMAPLVKALKAVKQSVDDKPVPGVSITPTDPLIRYAPADIDDVGAVQYFGYTDQRGGWYIRRYDTSVSPKTLRFCFGNSDYPTNFINRASLTYTIWSG